MDRTLRHWSAIAAGLALAGLTGSASAENTAREPAPLQRPALLTPRALQANLLGVARAGERLVAVGERGVIILSDDQGRQWRQVPVPVSVTLTAVRFADAKHGWAAGHSGVLLSTADGGATWQSVLDGLTVVKLQEALVRRLTERWGNTDPRVTREAERLSRLTEDGPDKPWFDLQIDSRGQLWLIGAYGLILRSTDAKTWESWADHLDNPKDQHLYALRAVGNVITIVGEQGLLLRSADGGDRFERLASPYKGSFFEQSLSESAWVVAGLRGNAYISTDGGQRFEPTPLPVPVSVTASAPLPDGAVLLADQSGSLYRAQGGRIQPLKANVGPNPSSLVFASDGSLIGAGRNGPQRLSFDLPSLMSAR